MPDNDERTDQVAGVASFFLALSTVTIALRCYCRIYVVRNFGLDDWFALVAWIFFVLFCGFCLTGTKYGTGKHMQDIPPEHIPIGLKWWWACEPVYVLANMALKMSIGLFLLRIVIEPIHRYLIWAVLIVTELFGTIFFFLFIFQCVPSSYFWDQFAGTGATGTCVDTKVIVDATYAYSAISCWGDWTISIIPVFIIRKLQMTPRTKIVVIGVLALGGIASTATIIRIPYVHSMSNIADFLYATTDVAIWSTAETGIGIAASSVATLRPLFKTFFARSRLFGNSSGTPLSGGNTPHQRSESNPGRLGYIRSKSSKKGPHEEIGLRSDVGKDNGVTTTIESDGNANIGEGDLERGLPSYHPKGGRKEKWKNSMWNTSESRLADDASSEEIDPVSAGWSPPALPERGGEIRIAVNRTVVQSSTVTLPEEIRRKELPRY